MKFCRRLAEESGIDTGRRKSGQGQLAAILIAGTVISIASYPNGVPSHSPGLVAIGDLPWVNETNAVSTPTGLRQPRRHGGRNPVGVEIAFGSSYPG